MSTRLPVRAIGTSLQRLDGPAKVTGTAPYAYEHEFEAPVYLYALRAGVARGAITAIDADDARALDGVLLVLTHENAPRLQDDEDRELWILQDGEVAFRGQYVGAVVAQSPELARQAAALVRVAYDEHPHDVDLRAGRDDLYAPEQINGGFPTDTNDGDVEAALAASPVTIDETYTTAWQNNNPLEPHTSVVLWSDDRVTVHGSSQGVHSMRETVAPLFGLEPERMRVISPHVGGGFGSKGLPHADIVLTMMAARMLPGRPVKYALTRQEMFALVGYRTPTIQHVRLGAERDGCLNAIANDIVEQTSRIKESAEQTGVPTRVMYAAPNRRTTHRLAALDVPVPSWMRAPGECPGMFGPEVALDELAFACGLDPVELRIRNDPRADPESGLPWSSRHLVRCLREGAERFGWQDRDLTPAARRDGRWLVGSGVASAIYPVSRMSGNEVTIDHDGDGRYTVRIGAADIGTGTWTALTQIAADALEIAVEDVAVQIGDSDLPPASVAGGSSGITSWGSTVIAGARAFRERYGSDPRPGASATAQMPENPEEERFAMYAFGAHFVEARIDADSGEIRVPRMLGMFDVGRIVNPRTARSQLIGGMTMGLSMALHEHSVLDQRFGHVVTDDFADYHIATNADVGDLQAHWLDETDPHTNPIGSKGIGEIGIVGAAAAVANAVHHATGIRLRDLPITPDKLLAA
jgi:xanthine dehydrogenase YagR molybdenum-binding subunit